MKNIVAFYLLFFVFPLSAQDCADFDKALIAGDQAAAKNYKRAYQEYDFAEDVACTAAQKKQARQKKDALFDKINSLRQTAEEHSRAAELAKREALREKENLERLNKFMKYNNTYLFEQMRGLYNQRFNHKLDYVLLVRDSVPSMYTSEFFYREFSTLALYVSAVNDLKEALDVTNILINSFPDSADLYNERSIIHYYLGNWAQAKADVETTIAKGISNKYVLALAYWNLALIESNLGNYENSERWNKSAIEQFKALPEDQFWTDTHVAKDIVDETSTLEIYLTTAYQRQALEIYQQFTPVFSGKASANRHFGIDAFGEIPISILLVLINYLEPHLKALPDDYAGYLLTGYLWELANYPEPAKKAYRSFCAAHREKRDPRYAGYAKNFESKLYKEACK